MVSNGTLLLKEEAKGRVSVHTRIVCCVEEAVVRVWQAVPNPPMIDRCNNEGRKKKKKKNFWKINTRVIGSV